MSTHPCDHTVPCGVWCGLHWGPYVYREWVKVVADERLRCVCMPSVTVNRCLTTVPFEALAVSCHNIMLELCQKKVLPYASTVVEWLYKFMLS